MCLLHPRQCCSPSSQKNTTSRNWKVSHRPEVLRPAFAGAKEVDAFTPAFTRRREVFVVSLFCPVPLPCKDTLFWHWKVAIPYDMRLVCVVNYLRGPRRGLSDIGVVLI